MSGHQPAFQPMPQPAWPSRRMRESLLPLYITHADTAGARLAEAGWRAAAAVE